ncbi:MAG: hypothetical protein K0M45_10085 [Candidatus Paracaedibacteraceae bacterium]|nr:hypothetical protein [Candidatus Paracaedibacteraceae bacterium]
MLNKTRCFLLFILSVLVGAIAFLIYHKYQANRFLEFYTHEQVLRHTKKVKHIPLIEELYRLGEQVASVKDLKSKDIKDAEQKKIHILLSKICKDSCLPFRCRIDPGLGHACRINCPARKVKFCVTSLKPLPINKTDLE